MIRNNYITLSRSSIVIKDFACLLKSNFFSTYALAASDFLMMSGSLSFKHCKILLLKSKVLAISYTWPYLPLSVISRGPSILGTITGVPTHIASIMHLPKDSVKEVFTKTFDLAIASSVLELFSFGIIFTFSFQSSSLIKLATLFLSFPSPIITAFILG